jgi:hypothetical protein
MASLSLSAIESDGVLVVASAGFREPPLVLAERTKLLAQEISRCPVGSSVLRRGGPKRDSTTISIPEELVEETRRKAWAKISSVEYLT